ncbi:hypothetical protein OG394_13005 [Kribbella sp. NBC_01245]|uniref:hypothetical protein n=1 Tax=Kribbella sp. NBC_01245 TaxID=2903578 RepID=UPI002E29A9F6|nr:hypothetical protein [Kribbella sp. NBC_01245]
MEGAELRQVRRWLWAELAVSRRPRGSPLAASRWAGDSVAAVRELRIALADAVAAGEVSAVDASVWAAAACLDGVRTSKAVLAAKLGLASIRSLDARLDTVDQVLAGRLGAEGAAATIRPVAGEALAIAALSEAAVARSNGEVESAEAYERLAREHQNLSTDGPRRSGADRVRRHRAGNRARPALARLATRLPAVPRLQPAGQDGRLTQLSYQLFDDAELAVGELDRAWRNSAAEAYPLLVDHAMRVTRPLRPGERIRLHLLELVVNIVRDTDSALTLPVTTRWLREAVTGAGPASRAAVAATRSRAHVLQLHGHLDLARSELDRALAVFPMVRFDRLEDRWSEYMDLLLRRAAAELCLGAAADRELTARLVRRAKDVPGALASVQLARVELNLDVLRLDLGGVRANANSALGRRYSRRQAQLVEALDVERGRFPLGALNSLVSAAVTVGQGATGIGELIERSLPRLDVQPAWANQFYRLRLILREATAGRRRAVDPAIVPLVPYAIRVEGTLPTAAKYLV